MKSARYLRLAFGSAAFALLTSTTLVHGQIDNRVNRGNDAGGRAHDANPGVGSGGLNVDRPSYDLGLRANSIATGNVTGLGAFHGVTPIVQNNAFRGGVPSFTPFAAGVPGDPFLSATSALAGGLQSTSLSNFYRQSVGVNEAVSGRPYTQGYFADPQRTIGDLRYIRQGLNVPGSSTPISPYVSPRDRLAPQPDAGSLLGLRDREDRRVGTAPGGWNLGWSRPSNAAARLDSERVRESLRPSTPDSGGVTRARMDRASLREDSLERMANELQRTRVREDLDSARTAEARGGGAPRSDDALLSARTRPPTMRGGTAATDSATPGAGVASVPTWTRRARPDTTGPSQPGDDMFADLSDAIRMAQSRGAGSLGIRSPARLAENPDEAKDEKSGAPGTPRPRGHRADVLRPEKTKPIREVAAGARWAQDVLDKPITTFAGRYQSESNRYMAEGEEALHAGQHYNAARRFELARTIDPENPLPLLAHGNALMAAGDYVSAVRSLTEGIRRFPQIAAFRMDLPALVGQRDVFDRRRADLEARLAEKDDPGLRFLLGYIELYSGLPEEGLNDLKKAAAGSPPDSIMAIFPDLLTGAKEVPAIQPRR